MKIKTFAEHLFKSRWQRRVLLMLLIMLGSGSGTEMPSSANTSKKPLKRTDSSQRYQAAQSRSHIPVLLGVYTTDFLGTQQAIDNDLHALDDWAGKRLSLAGIFMDIEDENPAYDIPVPLEQLQHNGYTAFINLASNRTAAEIARGDVDESLRRMAKAYASWSARGDRMAFIAPLPEMNGSWESYKEDPGNFKLAYQRIQQIFADAGVSAKAVRWVFAPNGWSKSEHRFENYYPGDRRVDVVAFSSYNWGYCNNAAWKNWGKPQEVYDSYIKRMQVMAPSKPIFISQTASTSQTSSGSQSSAKDQWLRDSYKHLSEAGVRAILYFNINKECDWALYSNSGNKSTGYRDAVIDPAFGYASPADLAQMNLSQ